MGVCTNLYLGDNPHAVPCNDAWYAVRMNNLAALCLHQYLPQQMHLLQANWFPTYTLGEDMALALEVQKAGWKGAYVKVSPHTHRGGSCDLHLRALDAGAPRLLHLQDTVHEKRQTGDAGGQRQ